MIRRPPRSTLDRSSAASDVYKRQDHDLERVGLAGRGPFVGDEITQSIDSHVVGMGFDLSLIHISEPTRPY